MIFSIQSERRCELVLRLRNNQTILLVQAPKTSHPEFGDLTACGVTAWHSAAMRATGASCVRMLASAAHAVHAGMRSPAIGAAHMGGALVAIGAVHARGALETARTIWTNGTLEAFGRSGRTAIVGHVGMVPVALGRLGPFLIPRRVLLLRHVSGRDTRHDRRRNAGDALDDVADVLVFGLLSLLGCLLLALGLFLLLDALLLGLDGAAQLGEA